MARFLADLAPVWRAATPDDAHGVIVEGQVQEQPGLRPGPLDGYLAAISVVHQTADLDNSVRVEVVRRTMAGIRRHPGVAPTTRRAAARRSDLAAILALLEPDEHLADARDAALLLMGWKAALRGDDLARMHLSDVRITADGLAVGLRRSKTDQDGAGVTVGIAPAPPAVPDPGNDEAGEQPVVSLDAVAAWVRWRNLLAGHGITTGPAWRAVDRHGRRPRAGGLHRNSIRLIVTRRAGDAGYDTAAWGAHSLRRGFATEAIAQGVPERDVQRHGRWRSRAAMAPYVDEARTFDPTNPTHWLH